MFFYSDRKALRVGDIVTISIIENAKANNAADTDLSRTSSLQAGLTQFFGKEKFLRLFRDGDELIKSNAENAFKGSGATTREGQLTATITAIVKEVLPNGNLVIQGTRALGVNHEEQYITITGIIRPDDVNRDNVILSTQVADASISIGGTGVVGDKQRSGWGTWIFDFAWPFSSPAILTAAMKFEFTPRLLRSSSQRSPMRHLKTRAMVIFGAMLVFSASIVRARG